MANILERKTRTGEKRYQVIVRLKGYPPQIATFKRKTDAVRWATQTEAAILEGRHFGDGSTKNRTFGEVVDRYLEDVVPYRHTEPIAERAIRRHLLWWKKRLGHYALTSVSPARISKLRDELKASPVLDSRERPLLDEDGNVKRLKSVATVNRYLASLSVMYSVAVREWGWLQQNPVAKVSRLREPRGRVRFLSDAERERLLTACRASRNPYLYTIVVLALSTGARHSEIMNLRGRDIDLERGVARLEKTKNNERRALPLTHVALELLQALYNEENSSSDALVFPGATGVAPVHISEHFVEAMHSAGIEDFRFHDLRHSAASYLAMNGATLAEIAEVLGHKTLQMVKRYAHLSDQHTAAVVERMNRAIFKEPANDNDEVIQETDAKEAAD